MADYYVDINGNITTKKKKQPNYIVDKDGNISVVGDIAPVKGENTWLKKGALEGGNSATNVGKTIAGSATDIAENLVAGGASIVEKAVDAAAYAAGGVGKLLGADRFASDMEAFIAKDLYDEQSVAKTIVSGLNSAGFASSSNLGIPVSWSEKDNEWRKQKQEEALDYVTNKAESDSVFGEKADSLVQSIGQQLATRAIGAVGIPWELTMALTSFGAEAENALNSGATFGQAGASAAIAAAGEIISEKLFSGGIIGAEGWFGNNKGAVDALGKGLAVNLWNTLKGYAKDIGEEAFEEVFSEVVSRFGTAIYKVKTPEELGELMLGKDAWKDYFDAAIGGGIMGGLGGGKNAVVSAATGRDYSTGMTQNEQKVFKAEYESRVAEAEKDGKISKKEKDAIYDAVVSDMEKGRISIDTIEEVLGGDTYKAYKDAVAKEDALSERFAFIGNKTNATLAEQSEYAELKTKLDEMKKTSQRSELKSKLGEEVFGLVQNDRLMESYNERGRRSQAFEADLTKYDAKSQATIKKAVESGILNNTRRTHEFVDMIAKISADKGVLFDFTNNEKLKGSVFAVDGKTVNGYVTKDGVTLNIDSAKSLNSVVGHEITHVLEGTELYTALQSAVKEYAKTKGDYQGRYDSLSKLYEGVKDADVDAELTADLVGDYLFTDTDFINNLAANKNVFQKIWDEIKYLCKVATAGSKEARELEKVKRAFEKAYQESGKVSNDTKYSITDFDGKPIDTARISTNELDTRYSLSHNAEIAKGQTDYIGKHKAYVTDEELAEAQRVTAAMVDVMMKYSNILPEDKIGKVLTKNGSYDRSVENTTICVRTLAYNEFVDKVQEELGRPLTQMESFLVSQKLYDIATEPQCLYCYVSLDRKAFNDMLLRYMTDRDTVIAKYNNSDKSPAAVEALYEEFLHGRKPTKEMRTRFDAWLGYVDDGVQLLSLADIATEDRQGVIKANGGILAEQLKDARKYAQSASWSKIQKNYVAYRDEILKLGDRVVKNLNEHYGLRWYSFSDYSAAFIVENMQQITDASIRGLKGLAYTKDTDFAEIFAPSGMNINISVFVNTDKDGNFFIDEKQSAKFEQAKALRERYPNVGIVATVTNDDALRWAASQEWSDVIIPFHIVRTGTDVAEYYKWLNYTSESADTIADKDMWNAYVDSLNLKSEGARKKVSKNIYPNEHKNDKSTYLALCESRGLTPRFVRFAGEDWYMKLVNETRLSADASATLKPIYDEEAAKASFQKFVDKGGYEGGWYHEGVDVDAEARAVADDVLAGKRANEVSYGRQDGFVPEDLIASRKTNRQHGRMSLSEQGEQFAPVRGLTYGKDIRLETAVPETVAPVVNAENATTTPAVATPDEIAPVSTKKPDKITTAQDRAKAQLDSAYTEMSSLNNLREASKQDFDNEIAELEAEYESKKNKNTKLANNILRRIERTKAMRESVDADYAKRISDVEAKVERLSSATYTTAMQRKAKQKEYGDLIEKLVGNTKTWVDKKLGVQYQTNTFKRNLRDVVRKADGSRDIAKADAIYNELQGKYNQHEAQLNRRANEIKKKFADLKLTNAEDVYVQMLGELRHNPETTLSEEVVRDYYERHKNKINADKVDKAIEMARELYDGLFAEVNAVLREQGMKEIPYRKGYFPHFTEEKQSLIAKLFNWKTQNNRIPTDIAGLTEEFNPNRKWVSFNKRRTSDVTDYNFSKGLDSYVSGALDWIYHIEDIQKRRAFENYIRYTHSDAGVKERIKAIQNNDEYDANEMQDQIDLVYAEANNPLNNFVTDLRTGTNTLAGKKSSMDRGVEAATNRQFYSVMTNISNRVSANMVGGSVSSALTNFIPITQSWGEVSPVSSLKAMRDTLRSMYADDGVIDKSDFLTNRLNANENLYKTTWDKISDGVTFMMSAVDNFTSQTVWRSKYMENINKGMSEAESIRNADEYAAGLMADRSRGNMPTIFDSKNPLIKTLTAFQLEVANQYNYMFKDMPQNMKDEAASKLVKGYLSMFIGAYAYNALYSSVVGRNAAFDPIRILKELLQDIGDDEEEPIGVVTNLVENVLEEVPFVGGLLGGGRVPIQSALPYNGSLMDMLEGVGKIAEGDWSDLTSEWLKPVYYGALPMGGGQIKKTAQGLAMFDEDLPIAGSYTNSGNLRFTVEDNIPNRVQAALFGQYASKNARQYFDENRTPLGEKQIQELVDVDIPIADYWEYRDGLKKQEKIEDKFEYIAGLDLPVAKKNILINNVVDRKTPVDLTGYDRFSGYEEFDFYSKNTEKYNFLKENGVSYERYTADETDKKNFDNDYSWYKNNPDKVAVAKLLTGNVLDYRSIVDDLGDLPAKEQKVQYINDLNMDYGKKIILYRTLYSSKEDKQLYNRKILEYLFEQNLPDDQFASILKTLGFVVKDGYVTW